MDNVQDRSFAPIGMMECWINGLWDTAILG